MKIFVIVILVIILFAVLMPFFNINDVLTFFRGSPLQFIADGFEFLSSLFSGFVSRYFNVSFGHFPLVTSVLVVFCLLWFFELIISHLLGGKE